MVRFQAFTALAWVHSLVVILGSWKPSGTPKKKKLEIYLKRGRRAGAEGLRVCTAVSALLPSRSLVRPHRAPPAQACLGLGDMGLESQRPMESMPRPDFSRSCSQNHSLQPTQLGHPGWFSDRKIGQGTLQSSR